MGIVAGCGVGSGLCVNRRNCWEEDMGKGAMIRYVLQSFGLTLLLLAIGLLLCLTALAGPARAAEVTPALVCQVQKSIRWRDRAWQPATCERVASALNATSDPVTMAAICLNESDWRPTAINVVRADVFDVGFCGVRCIYRDGKCSNGPAKGHTLAEMFEPATNISIAAQIVASKRVSHGRDWLRGYNGGTREHGYGARIGAIAAALGGVAKPNASARVRALVRRIVDAVTGMRGNT